MGAVMEERRGRRWKRDRGELPEGGNRHGSGNGGETGKTMEER